LAWNKEDREQWKRPPVPPPRATEKAAAGPVLGPPEKPEASTATSAEPAGRADSSGERPARTNVIPRGPISTVRPAPETDGPQSRARRYRPSARRVKRTLRYVDPVSVLKLSLIYYACFLLIWLVFVAVVYWLLEGMGVFEMAEEFARGAVFLEKGQELGLTLWFFERWAFLVGLTVAVLASLVNLLLAFLYNIAADLVGGVGMTFVERDL
jgi:hypothetical protein